MRAALRLPASSAADHSTIRAGALGSYVAAVPFMSGNGIAPPVLDSVNRPQIGTPLLLRSSNLDPSIIAVMTFISAAPLPIALNFAAPLGMPGCIAYIVLPPIVDGLNFNLGAPTVTANFGVIPNLPGNFFAQSACLSVATPPVNVPNILVTNAACLHVDIN
jgi:hypothetical protein